MVKDGKPFVTGLAATPLVLWIGLISAGSGHGDYTMARILLPWASKLTVVAEFSRWHTLMVIVAAVVQCPFYGFLITLRRGLVWPLLVTHLGMVIWLFTSGMGTF